MTEAEWLACPNAFYLLHHVRRKAGPRRLRLFACASCRRVWHLLEDRGSRQAVEASERYADHGIGRKGLALARAAAPARAITRAANFAAKAAAFSCMPAVAEAVPSTLVAVHQAETTYQRSKALSEQREYADVVRHIIGNPFRPAAAPHSWPSSVIKLAEAVYLGADCVFALHDALLDAGATELAGHFTASDHPKGCWALDLLLGKT